MGDDENNAAIQNKEQQHFEMTALECFLDNIHDHETVGDAIKAFNELLEDDDAFCEHCGADIAEGPSPGQCKLCKTMTYCSKDCQKQDWENGHGAECTAIRENHKWEQYKNELVSAPVESSVTFRHFSRFAALEECLANEEAIGEEQNQDLSLDHEDIGPRFRGRGRGRGPRGRRFWGGRRRYWGRPRYGRRWFGGIFPYAWGAGWSFPWMYHHGLWYPWWYWIPAQYYATQTPYIVAGRNYGVPPAPPGTWGTVAPPAGTAGYASIPYAPVLASIEDVCDAWSGGELEIVEANGTFGTTARGLQRKTAHGLRKAVGKVIKAGSFEQLMMRHNDTLKMYAKQVADGVYNESKARRSLQSEADSWASMITSVDIIAIAYLRVAQREESRKRQTIKNFIKDIYNVELSGLELDILGERNINEYMLQVVKRWAEFWTTLMLDPVAESKGFNINQTRVIRQKRDAYIEKYKVYVDTFQNTMIRHLDALQRYINVLKNRRTLTAQALKEAEREMDDASRICGSTLDQWLPKRILNVSSEITIDTAAEEDIGGGEEYEDEDESGLPAIGDNAFGTIKRVFRGRRYKNFSEAFKEHYKLVIAAARTQYTINATEKAKIAAMQKIRETSAQWSLVLLPEIDPLTLQLLNKSPEITRSAQQLLDKMMSIHMDYVERRIKEPKGSPIPVQRLEEHAKRWAKFWTILSYDPAYIPLSLPEVNRTPQGIKNFIRNAILAESSPHRIQVYDPLLQGMRDHFNIIGRLAFAHADPSTPPKRITAEEDRLKRNTESMAAIIDRRVGSLIRAAMTDDLIGCEEDSCNCEGIEYELGDEDAFIESFEHIDADDEREVFDLIGNRHKKKWIHGAIKHPGSFTRSAARAHGGRYKGRTMSFARHVIANRDHKHGGKTIQRRARLALTLSKLRKGKRK